MGTVLQITDLHIPQGNEFIHGIDIRGNFLRQLEAMRKTPHELLVITGDLALDKGEKGIYDWIAEQLKDWDAPVLCIPGNHDSPQLLEVSLTAPELPYRHRLENGIELSFIDSHEGFIPEIDLSWLENQMAETPQSYTPVFMHYPPIMGEVPHMDLKYALRNMEMLHDLAASSPKPVHVFSGHYHVNKSIFSENLNVHICPSPYFTIDDQEKSFATRKTQLSYRKLVFFEKKFTTEDIQVL